MIGTQTESAISFMTRTEPVASQGIRIWAPSTINGSPRPLVIWNHPASANEVIGAGYWAFPIIHAALNAGYMVVAGRNHNDAWTSATAEADVLNAHNYVNTNINPVNKVVLMGASMGGALSPITIANGSVPSVKGAVLIDPACSLSWCYGTASLEASINAGMAVTSGTLSGAMASTGLTSVPTTSSFPTIGTRLRLGNTTANVEDVTTTGASSGTAVAVTATTKTHASGDHVSDYPTKALNRDPCLRPASDYSGKRYLFISSTADTLCPGPNNADVLAALINTGAPTEVTEQRHIGGHLSTGSVQPNVILPFLARCFA